MVRRYVCSFRLLQLWTGMLEMIMIEAQGLCRLPEREWRMQLPISGCQTKVTYAAPYGELGSSANSGCAY